MSADMKPSRKERVLGGLWGAVVGDALGVPVEFKSRSEVQSNPVTGMRGQGTHAQEAGTWSDDSSLLLCTVDSLIQNKFDTEDIGKKFLKWYENGLWSAHGDVFDVGLTTADALILLKQGVPAEQAGGQDEYSNGNGSLMRILPVAIRFADEPIPALVDRVGRASAITHAHERSRMACSFYALVVKQLLEGVEPRTAWERGGAVFCKTFSSSPELKH